MLILILIFTLIRIRGSGGFYTLINKLDYRFYYHSIVFILIIREERSKKRKKWICTWKLVYFTVGWAVSISLASWSTLFYFRK
jgi:hypothetical protein